MTEDQNKGNHQQAPDGVFGEITLNDNMYVELVRTSGPPGPRTVPTVSKQWQSPKSESTPSNRARQT